MRGEEILTPERTAPAVVALAINYVRGAQAKSTPKINRWPTFLAGQLVLNVDASFTEGDYAGSCVDLVVLLSVITEDLSCRRPRRD